MNHESSYYVILSQPESFDLQKLSEIVASCLSLTPTDIIIHLKHSWGFLHNTQEMSEAKTLQEKLQQAGIDTFILPTKEIKTAPSPKVLRKAIPEEEGLVIEEESQITILPWNSFDMIGAAQIMETISEKKRVLGDGEVSRNLATTGFTLVTAVRISHDRITGKENIEKRTSSSFILDLVAQDTYKSIRIRGDKFDYSFLKDRMRYNVLMNFKNLYMDISKFLPHAAKNQGAQAMETNAMIKMRYSDASSYENEKLWLLQLLKSREILL